VTVLSEIFVGRDDCLGLYHLGDPTESGKKREGKAISYPNSKYPDRKLEANDYLVHFAGKVALGVVPVFLSGNTKWFAIDVDDYTLNHTKLAHKIYTSKLPIVHCRSKSGGAHLYGLFTHRVPAKDAVRLAKKWVEALGFDPKRTEVFPKQVKFDSPEAKGNWIIIPYFGGEQAMDFAIDENGDKVEFKDFGMFCKSRMITPEELSGFLDGKVTADWSSDEILAESPPCVIEMMTHKVMEGDGRNNAASHLSWYFRNIDNFFEKTDWQDKLNDFNNSYFDPPLSYRELNQVIKNHSGGKYFARCDVNPMAVLCDRETCLKRKFGIKPTHASGFYGEYKITALTKIDIGKDPIWKVFINGQFVNMDTETFTNPKKFRLAVLARLNILIPTLKQKEHDEIIGPLIKDALVIEEAKMVSSYGKIESCFRQWISQVIEKSRSKEKLLDGLPYYIKGANSILYRLHDFVLEYRRVYKENTDDREIYIVLKSQGSTQVNMEVGGRMIDVMEMHLPEGGAWFNTKEEGF
jgi:hypothetical protein